MTTRKLFFQNIFVASLFVSLTCFGQDDNPGVIDIAKLTFFNPGASYEKKIGRLQTLYGQVFMNTSIALAYSDALGNMSGIWFDPAAALQYRYYYNARRREERGKPTNRNNMNYVSVMYEFTFSRAAISDIYFNETKRRAMNRFGIVWGLQRNFPKRFSVDLNIGVGMLAARSTNIGSTGDYQTKTESVFTLPGQLNLGFWLGKKK